MQKHYLIRLAIAGIIGIAAICAVLGFYPVKIMDVQFTAVLQRVIIDYSLPAIGILAGIIIFTMFFGRFYCSIVCPFGILQEFAALLFKKKDAEQKNLPFKYFIAALTIGALFGGCALLIRYIDPYTMFISAISFSIIGLVFVFIILALVFFKNRYFCTNICPVGAILGLLSKVSLNKVYIDKENCVSCGKCAKSCPSGCIDFKEKNIENETCIKCLKCIDECKKGAIKYGRQSAKFSLQRRNLILAASAIVLFGGAIKAGIEISKNFAIKIRDVILPPGAKDGNRMANKCLNCNLCIQNCPNKILVKADDKFSAVHIDYSKGAGYCKYNCNECSNVCPSGAIKRISLDEKQKTRIGMASFNKEIRTRCGLCAQNCPTKAIKPDEKGEPFLDGSKCIGCGRCAKSCPAGAIDIFGINEQNII